MGLVVRVLVAGLAAVAAAAGPAAAQAVPHAVLAVQPRFETRPADWRDALTQGGRLPPHERLVVVTPDGGIVRIVEGEETQVNLPADLQAALATGALRATLVHNHLADRGLSCADFRQLAKPGVAQVVAVGGRGSVFEAAAGPEYDARLFDAASCRDLFDRVATQLSAQLGAMLGPRSEPVDQVPHVVARALASAGVIVYRPVPATDASATLFRYGLEFDQLIARTIGEIHRRRAQFTAAR